MLVKRPVFVSGKDNTEWLRRFTQLSEFIIITKAAFGKKQLSLFLKNHCLIIVAGGIPQEA